MAPQHTTQPTPCAAQPAPHCALHPRLHIPQPTTPYSVPWLSSKRGRPGPEGKHAFTRRSPSPCKDSALLTGVCLPALLPGL